LETKGCGTREFQKEEKQIAVERKSGPTFAQPAKVGHPECQDHLLFSAPPAYVNWLVTTLAAVFGTAALSPITAAGHSGRPWQESLVTAGFLSVGVVIVASSLLVLWGLRARAPQ